MKHVLARSTHRSVIAMVVAGLLAAACGTSSGDDSSDGNTSNGGATAAPAKGVTADTIKIGFTYPDLESLAKQGIVKVDHGPYAQIIKALVDDINAHGGVNGRKLELYAEKYSVLTNEDQLATCAKVTEDRAVFAVLGGFIGDANLCVAQQHSTALISAFGSGFNQSVLEKARAPWATGGASDERAVKALVELLDKQGRLKGKTIGVYGALSAARALTDLTVKTLKDAGYTVTETAINNAPSNDTQAANAQDKQIANRFKDKNIDTVFVLVTTPPGANFDAVDYHPTMYTPQAGLVAAGAFTNSYAKFPLVAGLAADANQDAGYDSAPMRHCRDVWKKASGNDIKPASVENDEGKSSGFTAMMTACTALKIFGDAADAAGKTLTYDTWLKGLESLGKIDLPTSPVSSFGPDKPDAQDSFQLAQFNTAWTPGSSELLLLPLGDGITQAH